MKETLEQTVKRIKLRNISKMNDSELERDIQEHNYLDPDEQITDINKRVASINNNARQDYLLGYEGFEKIGRNIAYRMGLVSSEQLLEKKKKDLQELKIKITQDADSLEENITNHHRDIMISERKKLMIDESIRRKEKAIQENAEQYQQSYVKLEAGELNEFEVGRTECELQELHMIGFVYQNEVRDLKAKYVLTFERVQNMKNVVSSIELDYQQLKQALFEIDSQIQEAEMLSDKGISPKKTINYLQRTFSTKEQCEKIKNNILRNTKDLSDAVMDMDLALSSTRIQNQELFSEKGKLANTIHGNYELKYMAIKQSYNTNTN